MNKYYTGVGSRSTPIEILDAMSKIASTLANKNYILRSGGADGADTAFERGCDLASGQKEIYIPWREFNNNNSQLFNVSESAMEIASTIHPAWPKLRQSVQKLHARNCYQVLGANLDTPSKVLICWTENGEEKGGTRTAIVLAKRHSIPVYNLAIQEQSDKLLKIING